MDATHGLSSRGAGRLLGALTSGKVGAVAFAVTIGLAVALRLYGLDWDRGYGYTPHPDERAILMKVGELAPPSPGNFFDADESPWNPRWFAYGSLPLYLLKTVQIGYSALPFSDLDDLRVTGRAISAMADVGTVVVVFLLGARIYGRREGLLASALVALSVLHIQLSHFYAVDTLLALFTVTGLYFMYRVARDGGVRLSVLAGVFVGLGLATKLSQAPIVMALVMAHLLYAASALGYSPEAADAGGGSDRVRGTLKGLAAAFGAMLVVFLVAQPYALLDWGRFYGDFVEQSEMVRRIRDYVYTLQYVDTTPYWYQVRQLATWGLGWPLGIVAWSGLLYASLSGIRLRYGLAYLAVGWGVPMALLLYSTSLLGIVAASTIAFGALAATLPLRSARSRGAVLLLSWVVPYFLITGAFQVKFIRYLIPIVPLLVLFGSAMLMALWDTTSRRVPALRPALAVALGLVVLATGAYATSYVGLYREPHTAVRTSEWINANAPPGAVILKEHWEEGIPNLSAYQVRELAMYDSDGPDKLGRVSRELASADYIVFYSNRLYGTVPRLPERYPQSGEYYRLLFSGGLGYELVNVETAYPELAGVSFVHDTLGRPNLPDVDLLGVSRTAGLSLGLGFADESFSVYDHPTSLVFENVARHDAATIRRAIQVSAGGGAAAEARVVGLMLSPEDAAAQRRGGTWSEIVHPESWASRVPVLAWILVIEGIALLAFPLAFVLFRPLPDRGFLLSKVLGLLLVALGVWLLASLRWVPFSRGAILIALTLVGVASGGVLAAQGREILAFVRRRWTLLVIGEALFLAAYLAFVVVRMANPDLWHPFRGGEKPMDFAYLNAVLRSNYMPPYDPWFGGGYLNYYYWGQFLVAMVIRATGIDPAVAFNLAVPTFFALTVGGAFSIVYNLAEGTRRRLGSVGSAWSPVVAALTGTAFVAIIGNLNGAVQVVQGAWRAMVRNIPFGEFDFWQSSRMMAPDPPGHEITEFPFFTFLFADLHAHLMALPFTLMAIGLALAMVSGATQELRRGRWGPGELARLAALGVAVGSLRLLNTWDFPTYALLAVAAVAMAEYLRHGGLGMPVVLATAAKSAAVLAVGYIVFLPYHLSSESFFASIEDTTNRTVLWQFLAINGLFVFVIGSYFVYEARGWYLPWWRVIARRIGLLVGGSPPSLGGPTQAGDGAVLSLPRLSVAGLAVLVVGYVAAVGVSGWLGSTVPFLVLLAAPVLMVGLRPLLSARPDGPQMAFVTVIVLVAFALAVGLDFYRVTGDIDRMNSVFKFYLQIWVLLALASAYLLWRLGDAKRAPLRRLAPGKKVWLGALGVLTVGALVYPVMGTQDRLRDRFDGNVTAMTLDGTAFMSETVYGDNGGVIDLSADLAAIRWLQGTTDGTPNVEGSPVLLEGQTPMYRWGGRVSVYTGLPGVVGWGWHQSQQRWGYRWAVDQRLNDVDRIYTTTDSANALALMRRYGVEYIYVGQVERLYYPAEGLAKFDGALAEHMSPVYESDQVTIYRLGDG